MTTPDGGGRRRPMWRVLGLFRPYRAQVALATVAIVLGSGLGVANPLLIRVVFDHAFFCRAGCPGLRLLSVLVAVMCCIPVLTASIGVGQTLLTNRVGQQVRRAPISSVATAPMRATPPTPSPTRGGSSSAPTSASSRCGRWAATTAASG